MPFKFKDPIGMRYISVWPEYDSFLNIHKCSLHRKLYITKSCPACKMAEEENLKMAQHSSKINFTPQNILQHPAFGKGSGKREFIVEIFSDMEGGYRYTQSVSKGSYAKITFGDRGAQISELTEKLYKATCASNRWKYYASGVLPFQATIIHHAYGLYIFRLGLIKEILQTCRNNPENINILKGALAQLDEEIVQRCNDKRLLIDDIEQAYEKVEKLKSRALGTTFENEAIIALRKAVEFAGKILKNGE